jgi:hypothetical protein
MAGNISVPHHFVADDILRRRVFILTLFCLLDIIFIWKVNTVYGFDLSWYLNGILFTPYKYTKIAHVMRDKFTILEGISVKNMLIHLG